MSKKISLIIIIIVLSLNLVTPVWAQDLTIDFTDSGCELIPDEGPIFSEQNMLPLDTVSRTVLVQNTGEEPASLWISLTDESGNFIERFFDSDPSMAEVLTVTVKNESDSIIYGPKTIKEWKQDGYQLLIGDMLNGDSQTLSFDVTFDNVGNDYQEKELTFDIYLNCRGGGEVEGDTDERDQSSIIEVIKRTPQVLGEAISRLPETGQTLLMLGLSGGLVGLGLFLKKRRNP